MSFIQLGTSTSPKARLICFPYAGANARSFTRWRALLPKEHALWSAELPGRGARRLEAFAVDMDALTDQLVSELEPLLDIPCVFFGHSMGAIAAYECARKLEQRAGMAPRHLIVSARGAPHRGNPHAQVHDLSDAHLLDIVRRNGGTPPKVLSDPELMALFLPIIRADFKLLASHKDLRQHTFPYPVTAMGGVKDRVDETALRQWRGYTSSAFSLRMFDGGHFFIHESEKQVVSAVASVLRQL
jgi:medium-chain acyl-[acyl-carrier-protein] hydrolase